MSSPINSKRSPEVEETVIDAMIQGFSQLNYAPDHTKTEFAYEVMLEVFRKLKLPLSKLTIKLLEKNKYYILDNILEYAKDEEREEINKTRTDYENAIEDTKEFERDREIAKEFLETFKATVEEITEPDYISTLNILEDRKNLENNIKNFVKEKKELFYLSNLICDQQDHEALKIFVKYVFVEPLVSEKAQKDSAYELTCYVKDKTSLEIIKPFIEHDNRLYAQVGDFEGLKAVENDMESWNYPLVEAIGNGYYKISKYIYEKFIKNSNNNSLYYCRAVSSGNKELAEYFKNNMDEEHKTFYNDLARACIQAADMKGLLDLKDKIDLLEICEEYPAYFPEIPNRKKMQTQIKMFKTLKKWIREKYNL